MNKKWWLLFISLLSFVTYAQSTQPNPYVTNAQQMLDTSAAQAKQALAKAYPPPVPMTPVTPAKINPGLGGSNAQPPPPPTPPQQPIENQPTTTDNQSTTTTDSGQTTSGTTQQQSGYQENVAVPPAQQSGSDSTGNNSTPNNMYR